MMRIFHFTGSHVFEFSTVEYTSSRRICTLVPIFLPFFGIPEALKVYHSKHFKFQLSETEFRWKTRLKRMRTISQPRFSGSGTLSLETRQLVFVEEAGFSQGVVKFCHVICLKHCFPSFKCDDKKMTVRKSSCNLSRTVSRF